jgi:pimeloyl-ACP methyl ester carboxylesterase
VPSLKLPDGRQVHYSVSGSLTSGAPVLVFHHGQPGAGLVFSRLELAAERYDLPVVALSRPGYAGSTRQPDRRVADVATDVAAVLDEIGAGPFVTAGWSGGGPHALACGARLGSRCLAVATIAGVAPYVGAEDLDWTAGMGPENAAEFTALLSADPALEGQIAELCSKLASLQSSDVVEMFGGLISEPDRNCLEAGFSTFVAEWFRLAAAHGHSGYWDDDQAFISAWGFDLTDIRVPVSVWWADRDLMVPPTHGEWLVAHVPSAKGILKVGEGHISLLVDHIEEIVDDLFLSAELG